MDGLVEFVAAASYGAAAAKGSLRDPAQFWMGYAGSRFPPSNKRRTSSDADEFAVVKPAQAPRGPLV